MKVLSCSFQSSRLPSLSKCLVKVSHEHCMCRTPCRKQSRGEYNSYSRYSVLLNCGKRLLRSHSNTPVCCGVVMSATLSWNPSHRPFSWTVVGSSVQQPVGVHGGHVGSCRSELAQFSTQRVAFMVQRVASIDSDSLYSFSCSN